MTFCGLQDVYAVAMTAVLSFASQDRVLASLLRPERHPHMPVSTLVWIISFIVNDQRMKSIHSAVLALSSAWWACLWSGLCRTCAGLASVAP
jgi:hypothetical protein